MSFRYSLLALSKIVSIYICNQTKCENLKNITEEVGYKISNFRKGGIWVAWTVWEEAAVTGSTRI